MFATKRLEEPHDPGPSVRTSARDLPSTTTREKPSAGGRSSRSAMCTTPASPPYREDCPRLSRPSVPSSCAPQPALAQCCTPAFVHHSLHDNRPAQHTGRTRLSDQRRALRGQVQDVFDKVVRGSMRSVIALCRTALRLVPLSSSRACRSYSSSHGTSCGVPTVDARQPLELRRQRRPQHP
jgi:hypothetical protein